MQLTCNILSVFILQSSVSQGKSYQLGGEVPEVAIESQELTFLYSRMLLMKSRSCLAAELASGVVN